MARTCPICRKPVAPRGESRSFPFCSDRCRLLDLGKWLGEEYRIRGPPAGDGAEPEARREGEDGEEDTP